MAWWAYALIGLGPVLIVGAGYAWLIWRDYARNTQ